MAGRSASGLAGKAFIGTGAGRGIAEAGAGLFAAEGAHGVVSAPTEADGAWVVADITSSERRSRYKWNPNG